MSADEVGYGLKITIKPFREPDLLLVLVSLPELPNIGPSGEFLIEGLYDAGGLRGLMA